MKTFLRIGALALSCLLFSCQKESSSDETGGTGGTNDDYFPSTAGSKWNLKSTSSGDYSITSLGTDSTINGKKYFKYDVGTAARQYVNKENGIYTSYAPSFIGNQSVSLIMLKDASVGTAWNNTINYQGMSNKYAYKLVSRDADKTINGKVFKNVITVEYQVSLQDPSTGETMTFGSGRNYYSKGVGPIASSYKMDFLGMEREDSTYLVSYIIK